MKTLRGAFRHDTCNAWITEVLNAWQNKGKDINNLVIVCDIALCHSRIENVLHETGAALLRLHHILHLLILLKQCGQH